MNRFASNGEIADPCGVPRSRQLRLDLAERGQVVLALDLPRVFEFGLVPLGVLLHTRGVLDAQLLGEIVDQFRGARRADQPRTFRAGGPSRPEARTPAGCSPDVDPLSASGLRHRGRRSVPAQHGTTPQTARSRPHRSRRHEITYSATPLDVCVLKGHASSELVSSCAMVYRRRAHPTP